MVLNPVKDTDVACYLKLLLKIFDPRIRINDFVERSAGKRTISIRSKRLVTLLLNLENEVISDPELCAKRAPIHLLLGAICGLIDSDGNIEIMYRKVPLARITTTNGYTSS